MNSEEKEQSLTLAEHYFRNNQSAYAKYILEKIIQVDPNNSKANELLAYIYENSGQFDISFQLLKVACTQSNCSPEALYYLGSIQLRRGLFVEAIESLQKSILKAGEFFEALHDLATAQASIGDTASAMNNYRKCLNFGNPSHELFYNIARISDELERFDEAIAYYDKALGLKPDYFEAWSNKGLSLHELKRYDEALAHYDKALHFKSDYAEGWSNKGVTLHELKRFDEALAHYDKALHFKPDYAEAWFNKGVTMHELKRYDEAITHYDQAIKLKPDINWVYGNLIHTQMQICSWSGLFGSLDVISKKVTRNEKVSQPFYLLSLNNDALIHKKASETYSQDKHKFNPILGPIHTHSKNQKIRIGYFSADFRNHPVSILTAELYELHDKDRFEITAFSFGGLDKSPIRLRLSQAFNQFMDVSTLSDIQIAKLARDLRIDIAVDLGGYTSNSRAGIFSFRAAPIQLSYIGYLGTMAADFYDYLLADKVIIPEELQQFYSEKIAYLESYQANDRKRAISEKQFTRMELGLPEKGFVFCCFNNNYKILPATFDGWMRILKEVGGSVLFLYAENKWVEANLKKEAEARGISSSRLVFGEHMPNDEYLARYRSCDLFLDTFPYNAGTTASDALWAGVPVLTLAGQSFASRVAASLLNAIDLPELITSSQEEYEALAIELALNPIRFASIKMKLSNNRLTTPLFDTPRFTKNLEETFIKMHERYISGLNPDHLFVS